MKGESQLYGPKAAPLPVQLLLLPYHQSPFGPDSESQPMGGGGEAAVCHSYNTVYLWWGGGGAQGAHLTAPHPAP